MPREFIAGIYPRIDDEEAEWAIYSTTTRTWSDFQGNLSDTAHERVMKIAKDMNNAIKEASHV